MRTPGAPPGGCCRRPALRHRMVRNTRELLRRYQLPVPKRDPREVVVEMTPAESALYTAVEDFIGDAYRAASLGKRSAVGFAMTVYRRRLASSFEALKRTLNGRLMRAGPRTVGSFDGLLAALDVVGELCDFPLVDWPGVTVSVIA